jgi:hypothetical protein
MLTVIFIIAAYCLGWFFGEDIRQYFRYRMISRNQKEIILKRLSAIR